MADLLAKLGIERKLKQQQALLLWDKVVGEKIASRTRAVGLENGKLFVGVDSASWRNELIFMKGDIIVKLNAEVGDRIVEDIVFIGRR